MAKKRAAGGPNKAQLIRDYMKDNPKAGPKIVAEAVNGQHNLKVSAQYVSTMIKSLDKKELGARRKMGRPKGNNGRGSIVETNGGSDVISSLIQAEEIGRRDGGVAKAKELASRRLGKARAVVTCSACRKSSRWPDQPASLMRHKIVSIRLKETECRWSILVTTG